MHLLAVILTAPVFYWWLITGRRETKTGSQRSRINLGKEVPPGVSFTGFAIMVNSGEDLNAYEARCTHLGCRINAVEGNELLCPCHGSRFNLSGEVTRGPAARPLKKLNIQTDPATGDILVRKKEG